MYHKALNKWGGGKKSCKLFFWGQKHFPTAELTSPHCSHTLKHKLNIYFTQMGSFSPTDSQSFVSRKWEVSVFCIEFKHIYSHSLTVSNTKVDMNHLRKHIIHERERQMERQDTYTDKENDLHSCLDKRLK